jgi:arabinofuranosyltransferase
MTRGRRLGVDGGTPWGAWPVGIRVEDNATEAVGTRRGTERPESGRARGRRRPAAGTVVLPGAVVAAFLFAGWQRRWTVDDAFINFRVVDQFLAGNGPVFNVGERVEATTSTLWAAILVVIEVVSPFGIEWGTLVACLAFGVAGLLGGMAGAIRLADLLCPADGRTDGPAEGRAHDRRAHVIVPVGAAAYLGAAGTWDWATGGLENGLGIGWLGLTFWAVVALVEAGPAASRRRLLATAFLVGLGLLVRPDFAAYCAGFALPVVAVTWRLHRWRGLAAIAGAALALPLAVQVFRMGYYAQLVPNPLHAKESGRAWWSQGWEYLAEFVGRTWLLVPVGVTAAWVARTWRRATTDWRLVVAGIEAGAALHVLGIVRAGGDYMHARLLLPAWFAVLLPICAVRAGALATRYATAAVVALGAWAVLAAAVCRPSAEYDIRTGWRSATLVGRHPVTAADNVVSIPFDYAAGLGGWPGYHSVDSDGTVTRTYRSIGARSVVPAEILGLTGYTAPLDVWVHDRLGLADPVVARVELDHRGRPGHEKVLPGPWVAAVFLDPRAGTGPSFGIVNAFAVEAAGVDTTWRPERFAADRSAATEALTCGELGELVHDTRAPLDAKRFLGNMVDAVRLHGFRFPSDAQEARDRLCG